MKKYGYLLVLLTIANTVRTQSLDAEIKAINTLPPAETIHIHFDRTVYMPGDTIWFKAYLRQGSIPSGISTVLYTHLYDASGKVIVSKQLPVLYYSAHSFFVLPDSMHSSLVGVTAYTPFIAGNHPSFIFQQFLPVLENPEQVLVPSGVKTAKPQLQFFPEGGVYVANTETKIAIKASDQNGKPLAVKGIIKDSYGDTVTFFQTNEIGFGSVKVKADEEGLTAVWWSADNTSYTADLPVVNKEGAVVHVEKNSKSDYVFKVRRNPDVFPERAIYQLLVYTPGLALFEAQMNLTENPIATGIIKADSLPAGVITFLLLDEKKNILSQRSVYHALEKTVTPLQVVIKEKGLGKRALNIVELELPDEEFTNLSVAVTDADLLTDKQFSNDIAAGFLLNNELEGNKFRYETVLKNEGPDAETIDMLMLIYPRMKAVSNVAAFTQPVVLTASKFIKLKGEVTGLSADELQKAGKLNMIFQTADSAVHLLTIPVEQSGKFEMDNLVFYDSARVSFYFDKKPKGMYSIKFTQYLNEQTAKPFIKYPDYVLKANDDSSALNHALRYAQMIKISKGNGAKYLQDIVVTGKKKSREQELDDTYTSGQFRNDRAYRFDIMNDPYFNTYTDIISYLRAKLPPAVNIVQSPYAGGEIKMSWRGHATMLYIDEQYVRMTTLLNVPIDQVAYIKVFRPIFLGLPVVLETDEGYNPGGPAKTGDHFGSGGAIAIYTKRSYVPEYKKQIPDAAAGQSFTLIGFSAPQQFYSPDYAESPEETQLPDVRKTLYWNPVLIAGEENKKLSFRFFTNDLCKSYRIVVQGMDAKGRIVYYEKIIK